ncbi:uncharacterized protein LOC119062212 [Artibeus jamaicensis]|uniref:uncharacterized protein LOC119062212 n=1 Tax=Artibeus jamaicensis TaxID=9417 RepID=UPI00235B0D5E|nr:uncharacterized protein LOC119062212 [Artibeus jamaicensis]
MGLRTFPGGRPHRSDLGRPGPARGGFGANQAEPKLPPRSAPPARQPLGWARAERALRASPGRGPSSVLARATCAESRGFPRRLQPPRGGRDNSASGRTTGPDPRGSRPRGGSQTPQAPPGRWRPRPEADVRKRTRRPRPQGAARRGWALDAGSRPWGREGATAEVGPRAGDGAAPGSQGARLRGVPETVSACRQVESSPGQVWTGASRTNLLRATSGNFLKRNTDRFGFSVHFYQFGKVTKGVRTARPLQAGGTGPVAQWPETPTGPAFSSGCSQVHCENLPGVGVCTEQTPSLQVPGCLQSAVVGEAGEICMDLDFPWNDPVLMVTVVSHPAGLVGPGSISDRKAVVASRWRTRGADLPPLGFDFLDFLWATLREPRCSQPALEGAFVLGAGRNSEISGGSSAVAQHSLALKGNSDQWRWLPHPTQQPGFCLNYLGSWPCLAWSCPAANNI